MMEITRGTTPTLTLGLPFELESIEVGYFIIQQNKKILIEKAFEDCECTGAELLVKLTQEDTLKLSHCFKADMRLVIKTVDGERHESKPMVLRIADTSKGGVI